MNLFVADPEWGWWIVWYFYLGGIAAGAYFTATLIDLVGREEDRGLARLGYWIAFPLVIVCGLLLTVDLGRPERFWHMLFKSEVVDEAFRRGWPWSGEGWSWMVRAPLLKYWSPMSVGSWALMVYGLTSFLSFLGSLWPDGRLARWFRRGVVGRSLQLIGTAFGFFVASYTGALLTATNQPLWSDSHWIAPLFLTSAASTGIALMILLARYRGAGIGESLKRLKRADACVVGLEAAVFVIFLASLGGLVYPLLKTWNGIVLIVGTAVLSLIAPLVSHSSRRLSQPRGMFVAAACALLGGFVLRYAILMTPPELLTRAAPGAVVAKPIEPVLPTWPTSGFSPEDGRLAGGGPGADPGNRPAEELQPRSKVFHDE